MRNRSLGFVALSAVLVACIVTTVARSQEKPAGKDKPAAAAGGAAPAGMNDEMMKAMADAAAPGEHHKHLEAMVGNFKYVNKFKMDPAQEWNTTEGEYSGEMGMGGRYLLYNVKGNMMGMEFNGMGCLGYDNVAQKFVSGWIDNMGTGLMRAEGMSKDGDKTIVFEGEMLDPMTKKMTKYKNQYEIKSNDEFVMRWWSPSMTDGKMFESMVISFTRVK